MRLTNHVSHGLGFDTAGHTTWCPRSLNLVLITFGEVPDRVVWMTENPEIISTDIGELLKVGLVYPRLVEGFDEFVRSDRNFWGLRSSRSWGKKQRAKESKHALVGMWESNEIIVGGSGERVLIIPKFSPALLFVETWQRARREKLEQ